MNRRDSTGCSGSGLSRHDSSSDGWADRRAITLGCRRYGLSGNCRAPVRQLELFLVVRSSLSRLQKVGVRSLGRPDIQVLPPSPTLVCGNSKPTRLAMHPPLPCQCRSGSFLNALRQYRPRSAVVCTASRTRQQARRCPPCSRPPVSPRGTGVRAIHTWRPHSHGLAARSQGPRRALAVLQSLLLCRQPRSSTCGL